MCALLEGVTVSLPLDNAKTRHPAQRSLFNLLHATSVPFTHVYDTIRRERPHTVFRTRSSRLNSHEVRCERALWYLLLCTQYLICESCLHTMAVS